MILQLLLLPLLLLPILLPPLLLPLLPACPQQGPAAQADICPASAGAPIPGHAARPLRGAHRPRTVRVRLRGGAAALAPVQLPHHSRTAPAPSPHRCRAASPSAECAPHASQLLRTACAHAPPASTVALRSRCNCIAHCKCCVSAAHHVYFAAGAACLQCSMPTKQSTADGSGCSHHRASSTKLTRRRQPRSIFVPRCAAPNHAVPHHRTHHIRV